MAMDSPRPAVWPRLVRDIVLTLVTAIALFVVLDFLLRNEGTGFLSWLGPTELDLIEAGAVLLVGWLFARSIGAALQRLLAREGNARHATIVRLVVNGLVGVVVLFALFYVGGVTLQNLFFGSAFLGVVLGLAGQTVLANVFAGLVILIVAPFRVNERISLISSSYGAIWPSYPHELGYPTYTGTVREIGLFYTVMQLDTGRMARVPNSVIVTALVVNLYPGHLRQQRVRMTFPLALPAAQVEAVLPEVERGIAASGAGIPAPRFEVADISPTSWDGVVVVWTMEANEEKVRDAVMRLILPRVGGSGPRATGA